MRKGLSALPNVKALLLVVYFNITPTLGVKLREKLTKNINTNKANVQHSILQLNIVIS